MDSKQFQSRIASTAFAFRGYNVANLGRSGEFLDHPQYQSIFSHYLQRAQAVCRSCTGRQVQLIERVRQREETTLESYGEAVALIVAVELAQIEILREFFGIEYTSAKLAYGYSLGEITAVVAGGVTEMEPALEVLLALADDCVDLSPDITLGVVFSRGGELPMNEIERQCLLINQEGRGVVGVSTYLSPNSLLLLGQQDTLDRFRSRINEVSSERIFLRKNEHRWPPLHTPIVWQRHISNRAAVQMHTMPGGLTAPQPPVLSMVTGKTSYTDLNARQLLAQWTDHPQRLWDAVYTTLTAGIETVVHVGPAPNIIPATFKRLKDNVEMQTKASLGLRAVSGIVTRPWLKRLLPARTALLRAPLLNHVILEDWLLAQPVAGQAEAKVA